MSNCNNDCKNCKIEDFCGYSVDTLGYAEFSRVVEEHDAKVRADAIEKFKQKLISYMTNYKPMYLNLLCVIEEIANELKEQNHEITYR